MADLAELDPHTSVTKALLEQFLAESTLPDEKKESIREDCQLSLDLQAAMLALGKQILAGESVTWEQVTAEMNKVAEEHGIEGGLPMPHVIDDDDRTHRLILADRAPLSWTRMVYPTEAAQISGIPLSHIRNSWDRLGDESVIVVNTTEGPMSVRLVAAGARLRKLMTNLSLRSDLHTMTAEAELKAIESLKSRVNEKQYRLYVIQGAFCERSPRSDLVYMFRKGLPTLAMSWHGHTDGAVIAALCFHPLGYYEASNVGVMTPTDEVIAALLTMRADEHYFWRKSGQWHAADPRAAL